MNDLAVMCEILPQITPENIEQAEAALLNLPQVACDVIHRFGPGIYIREVFIPAGTFAIGHHQKYEHMNVFLKGAVTMFKDGQIVELRAPMSFVGQPGRKIGYVTEDMYWQNIYATDETDIEKLEQMFFEKDAVSQAHAEAQLAFAAADRETDLEDYASVLREFDLSQTEVDAQVNNESDQISLPLDGYKFMVSPSPIHGKGIFATAPIADGEVIAPARINGLRTQAGRYTNHAANPNALMVAAPNGDIYLVARNNIKGIHGGIPVEEITIDYRQSLAESAIANGVRACQQ